MKMQLLLKKHAPRLLSLAAITSIALALPSCTLNEIKELKGEKCPSIAKAYLEGNEAYCTPDGQCSKINGEPCSDDELTRCADFIDREAFSRNICPEKGDTCLNNECIAQCQNSVLCGKKCCTECNKDNSDCKGNCEDGEIRCDGNTLQKCQNDQWIDEEICETKCSSDDKKCIECLRDDDKICGVGNSSTKQYICKDQNWVEKDCKDEGDDYSCYNGECIQCSTEEAPKCQDNVIIKCNNEMKWQKTDCTKEGKVCDPNASKDIQCLTCIEGTQFCKEGITKRCVDNQFIEEKCANGCNEEGTQCKLDCQDASNGTTTCDGNKIVKCENGAQETTACSAKCFNAQCVECIPSEDVPECTDDKTLRRCVNYEWKTQSCYKCDNNTCNECDSGMQTCVDKQTLNTCIGGIIQSTKCADNQICHNNQCITKCTENQIVCKSTEQYQICKNSLWVDNTVNNDEICFNNKLTKAYLYVKIVDETTDSSQLGGLDPGADIDAICIDNKSCLKEDCAIEVMSSRFDDDTYGDPMSTLKCPNAFFPDKPGKCVYYDDNKNETFFSVGGKPNGGYLIVKMGRKLLPNAKLNVYELGFCTTTISTGDKYLSNQEPFSVYVGPDPDINASTWVKINMDNAQISGATKDNQGIVPFTIIYK